MPKSKARTTSPGVCEKRSEAQHAAHANGHAHAPVRARAAVHIETDAAVELSLPVTASVKNNFIAEKIKELVQLAQEQGHLTFCDIHDALPNGQASPEDLEEIHFKLQSL